MTTQFATMNWFDTKAISSLLKEAQKQIDKALDIKDDEEEASSSSSSAKASPKVPAKGLLMDDSTAGANWNEKQTPDTPITVSPTVQSTIPISNDSSESLEMLTPSSELISPQSSSSHTLHGASDSVELVSAYDTSKGISQIDSLINTPTTPESIELVTDNTDSAIESISPIDDPSTIDTELPVTVKQGNLPITTPPSRSGLRLNIASVDETDELPKQQNIRVMNESNDSDKTIVSTTDVSMDMCDIRTTSGSTTSFEEICPAIRTYHQIELTDSSAGASRDVSNSRNSSKHNGDSADEVETGTSSDIEVISSPSTNCSAYRESPMKQGASDKTSDSMVIIKKGHFREPSDLSIQSTTSEDSHFSSQSETEKLLKRINELSELLEQRENKMLEMGRRNSELVEANADMQARLDARLNDPLELTNVTEEYTQRLSALEKKFQQTIREKEAFRKELAAMKQEFVSKVSKDELERMIGEKDGLISELRMEGEKLSKQILNLNNIIKKLRAKEKENDAQTKSHKEQISGLTDETERLKKSLSAKENVERSQIEAVHKLSSECKKLEEENSKIKSQNEDLTQKFETLKASFDAAKKELLDLKKENKEMSRKITDFNAIQSEKQEAQCQNQQMSDVITELKRKWKQSEEQQAQAMITLRQENTNLLRQLEEAEFRLQEQTEAYSVATVPLMKQIETLRGQLSNRTMQHEKREQELSVKLEEAEMQIKQLSNSETQYKENVLNLKSQTVTLETRLADAMHQVEEANVQLQAQKIELERNLTTHRLEMEKSARNEKEFGEKIKELERKLAETEEKLKKRRQLHIQTTLPQDDEEEEDERTYTNEPRSSSKTNNDTFSEKRSSSPTLSLSISMADSFTWQPDDLDCISQSGGPGALNPLYGSSVHHQTSLMENLQATIRQKDGEISQLQREIKQLVTERQFLSEEVAKLSLELENIKENIKNNEDGERQHAELQQQYNALLQMYGEKIEETEELKLDLVEVKEMYKSQLEELLQAQKSA
ncbi:TATA element modulatory factor [Culicoides brevitarsis]|uniref:TATA element modulatory factor n=1 Tax=Culicoides brevitarsis TaxID=469753 RepID=UPI00307B36C6